MTDTTIARTQETTSGSTCGKCGSVEHTTKGHHENVGESGTSPLGHHENSVPTGNE